MKTLSTKPTHITRTWHLIDAKDQVLGRLSTQIATKLTGKHKTYFASHLDCGDYVVVINAAQVAVTGKKLAQKRYNRHSNFPGGFRTQTLKEVLANHPTRVIESAVKGMLPKNKLQSPRLKRLKIFANDQHPYQDKFKD